MKQRVLILCTGNSARSQMAEGMLRHLAGDQFEVYSAGSQPTTVNPLAIQVMSERGIDLSGHRSKHLKEFLSQPFDYVITVCDQAAEVCPIFPGRAQHIHWSFPDPAAVTGTHEERFETFQWTRNAIEQQLKTWLAEQAQAQLTLTAE
jgi:arsenate reductase